MVQVSKSLFVLFCLATLLCSIVAYSTAQEEAGSPSGAAGGDSGEEGGSPPGAGGSGDEESGAPSNPGAGGDSGEEGGVPPGAGGDSGEEGGVPPCAGGSCGGSADGDGTPPVDPCSGGGCDGDDGDNGGGDSAPSVSIQVPASAAPGSQISIAVTGTDDHDVSQLLFFNSNDVQIASFDCTGVQASCSVIFSVTAPSTESTAYTFKARSKDSIGQLSQVASGSGTTTTSVIISPPPVPPPAPGPVTGVSAVSPVTSETVTVEFPSARLFIRSSGFPESDCLKPGESAWFAVQVENKGKTALKDVKFAATVSELNIYSSDGPTVLHSHDKSLHWFNIEVPYDAPEETQYLRVEIGNNDFKRVVYRTFVVDSSC